MTEYALATTLHDPGFNLESLFLRHKTMLKKVFPEIAAVLTKPTEDAVQRLSEMGRVTIARSSSNAETYKQAIKSALGFNTKHIFYVDFDRLLHWLDNYPDELLQTLGKVKECDFALIGRTERAFLTHPEMQTRTEKIVNILGEKIIGVRDIISAVWWFSSNLAKQVLKTKSCRLGFYTQWPLFCWERTEKPLYLEVEGLEWETPDKCHGDIVSLGYEKWLSELQNPKQWKYRLGVMEECVKPLLERVRQTYKYESDTKG